jgi:hypothetical protein
MPYLVPEEVDDFFVEIVMTILPANNAKLVQFLTIASSLQVPSLQKFGQNALRAYTEAPTQWNPFIRT